MIGNLVGGAILVLLGVGKLLGIHSLHIRGGALANSTHPQGATQKTPTQKKTFGLATKTEASAKLFDETNQK